MPCYDGQSQCNCNNYGSSNETKIVYVDQFEPQFQRVSHEIKQYEAAFCAILNELEKRGILNEIILEASVNGQFDLMPFWQKHRQDDSQKLMRLLLNLSDHERSLVKNLLNNEKEITD